MRNNTFTSKTFWLFLIFSFFQIHSTFAQGENQHQHARFNIGFETGGAIIVPSKRAEGMIPNFRAIRIAPYFNFRLGKKNYVGLNYEYETGKLDGVSLESLQGFGIHARRYFEFIKNKAFNDRLQIFGELGYFRLDHFIDEDADFNIETLPDFSNQQLQFTAGFNFRLFNSFYTNIGLRPTFNSKGKNFQFTNRLSFEYHFKEKRAPFEKRPRLPKDDTERSKPFDLTFFLRRSTIGTSYTYIFDDQENLPKYREKTWNFNIATSLSNDLDLGIAFLNINVSEGNDTKREHHLFGSFLQYDINRKFDGNRVFIETGYYKGNLCTCGEVNPYYEPNLDYISFGGGMDIKLSKRIPLVLDLSFLWYYIINQSIEDRWSISQYVVGLNYRLFS